ncbi:MAG: hypothetical protein J5643_08115 [Lachnospiraceae bacterium]|nr:hypothetical protein [Lachnospiraceae bacterium]
MNLLPEYFNMVSFNLFLTLIVEVPVAFLLGVRKSEDLETVVFTNAVSNPVLITVVFLLLRLNIILGTVNVVILLMEIIVVFAEGAVYRRFLRGGKINPFLLSFLANVCSFAVGAIL